MQKVKVSGGDLRFGQYLNKALVNAEDEAKAMGDEYVSVEHLFLSMSETAKSQHEKNPSASLASPENVSFRHCLQSEVIREWSVTIRKLLMIR